MGFALAAAYRVPHRSPAPSQYVLAQNGLPHHVHSRVEAMYTTISPA